LERKDTIKEIIFNSDKFVGTKMGLNLLFISLFFILQTYVTHKLIMTILIQITLIVLILFLLGKIFLYNRKENKKTTLTDKVLMISTLILLIYNTFS
jgi:cbb3-type cytochrome oxidase subunit 3